MGIRLNKVLSELNIGVQTVIEFLKTNHIGEVRDNLIPNSKITDEQYMALLNKYGNKTEGTPGGIHNEKEQLTKDEIIGANKAKIAKFHSEPKRTEVSHIYINSKGEYKKRSRKQNGKYQKKNYDNYTIYVNKLKEFFEEKYCKERIFMSDIEMMINKFQLRDNPECWKIKEQVKRYADEHNNNMFISSIKRAPIVTPLEEIVFSWDDISFRNGYIEISDKDHVQKYRHEISASKEAYNAIKKYFIIKYEELEIRIVKGKFVFNDEARFVKLLSSIKAGNVSSYVPDLELSPKSTLLTYFNRLSKADVKKYILLLKHKYLSYLCVKHKDKYRIQYTIEKRVNLENEALENAFVFTVSESNNFIVLVYENTEDDRSSIVFYVRRDEYNLAIDSICGYFSSWKYNKRETLATYDVKFKNSGIIKFNRIYHNDYNQWKKSIDAISY